jgi:hypothetical protein
MAQLYFNGQLVATSSINGVLSHHLVRDEIVITFDHKINKFHTILIYDDETVHLMMINVKGDDLESGEVIVDYVPFDNKVFNYHAYVLIYEQPKKLSLPMDDFDMEDYITNNKLKLIYTIHFTILQKLDRKPNLFSNRVYNKKLMSLQNII